MIKTEREYREAVSALDELRSELRRVQASAVSRGRVAVMKGRLSEMTHEIEQYERLRAGDLSSFNSVEEFGRLLIAARIARGLSQRELAERLGVHESQVSRDERNEYEGITLTRWISLCDALSVEVRSIARLEEATPQQLTESSEDHRPLGPSVIMGSTIPSGPASSAISSSQLKPSLWVEAPSRDGWRKILRPIANALATGGTGQGGIAVYQPAAA